MMQDDLKTPSPIRLQPSVASACDRLVSLVAGRLLLWADSAYELVIDGLGDQQVAENLACFTTPGASFSCSIDQPGQLAAIKHVLGETTWTEVQPELQKILLQTVWEELARQLEAALGCQLRFEQSIDPSVEIRGSLKYSIRQQGHVLVSGTISADAQSLQWLASLLETRSLFRQRPVQERAELAELIVPCDLIVGQVQLSQQEFDDLERDDLVLLQEVPRSSELISENDGHGEDDEQQVPCLLRLETGQCFLAQLDASTVVVSRQHYETSVGAMPDVVGGNAIAGSVQIPLEAFYQDASQTPWSCPFEPEEVQRLQLGQQAVGSGELVSIRDRKAFIVRAIESLTLSG
jgi:hypothetical protein